MLRMNDKQDTHSDKIREMSDEKLAEWLSRETHKPAKYWYKWLRRDARK